MGEVPQYRAAPDFFTADLRTPWGAAIDFRVAAVREFYVHNALYWLREYRLDGLRFDSVHAIFDPSPVHMLTELARRVRTEVSQEVHPMLEYERNQACLLREDPVLGPRLCGAQWNDDLHHAAHALITGERIGHCADFADGAADRPRRALGERLHATHSVWAGTLPDWFAAWSLDGDD
jgi:maltooligosyltrehalose trehalohydrolase